MHPSLIIKTFFVGMFLFVFFMPFFVSADGLNPTPLVPCGQGPQPSCNFADLVHLAQHIITFLLIIAGPIAAILFSYAGFLYLTAQDDTGKISQAHGIFTTVFVGLVIALAAWLVVSAISSALLKEGYSLLEGIQ